MSTRPHLLAPEVRANPFPLYAWLRRERPVCQVEPGGLWAVSRFDDIQHVLRDTALFSSAGYRKFFDVPWLPRNPIFESLLVMDDPQHARLRALIGSAFTPLTMHALEPRLRQICTTLRDQLPADEPVDFIDRFALPLPALVVADMLGIDPSRYRDYKRWGDHLGDINPGVTDLDHIAAIRRSVIEMCEYIETVIEARRSKPGKDLVSALLAAELEGHRLSQDEVVAFVALLLIAGFETTTSLLAHCIRVLAEKPSLVRQLQVHPELVPAFILEVLRYEPPVHAVIRIVARDTSISGVQLPAGAPILAMVGAAGRDERRFPNPDVFDMSRPAGASLAFGHGVHFCIGAALAKMEARIATEVLLQSWDAFTVTPEPIAWSLSLTVRGPIRLPVILSRKIRPSVDELPLAANA